jgi:hypothetical protein
MSIWNKTARHNLCCKALPITTFHLEWHNIFQERYALHILLYSPKSILNSCFRETESMSHLYNWNARLFLQSPPCGLGSHSICTNFYWDHFHCRKINSLKREEDSKERWYSKHWFLCVEGNTYPFIREDTCSRSIALQGGPGWISTIYKYAGGQTCVLCTAVRKQAGNSK